MLVASVVSGLFFTILVWLDSHTWIYIRKKYVFFFFYDFVTQLVSQNQINVLNDSI